MKEIEEQRIVEELGRTQTVKDVRAAYNAVFEAQRQLAVRLKHAMHKQDQIKAEIETFLDDVQQITGLPRSSRLFAKIASLTLARRLARRYMQQDSGVDDTFPNGW